jgi:isopentenyl-diphosphate delta-isomerase
MMQTITEVILVNEKDEMTGTMEKMEAHQKAMLHRAFSVFIFNSKGEMLLQQRASAKYHSPDLWSNACCSHPMPGEKTIDAAHRRLREELGFDTLLEHSFSFIYQTPFDNGLTEHEFDHVFVGNFDGIIKPDADEVKDFCYMGMDAIRNSMEVHPHKFTTWFRIAFPKLEVHLQRVHI